MIKLWVSYPFVAPVGRQHVQSSKSSSHEIVSSLVQSNGRTNRSGRQRKRTRTAPRTSGSRIAGRENTAHDPVDRLELVNGALAERHVVESLAGGQTQDEVVVAPVQVLVRAVGADFLAEPEGEVLDEASGLLADQGDVVLENC
jgi:hypothetical protein